MATEKLTIRLDHELVARARQIARERGIPLSRLIAELLQQLPEVSKQRSTTPADWKQSLPPRTRRLVGLATGAEIDETTYRQYLEARHR